MTQIYGTYPQGIWCLYHRLVKKVLLEIPVNNEYTKFSSRFNDARLNYIEIYLVIESVFHVFEEITLPHGIETIITSKTISSLEAATKKDTTGERCFVHQAVKKVVLWAESPLGVNELTHMKVNSHIYLQAFNTSRHTRWRRINYSAHFCLVTQYAEVAIADKTKFYD